MNPTIEQIDTTINQFRDAANNAHGQHQNHVATVKADKTLSERGKQEKIDAARPAIQAKIDEAKHGEEKYLAETRNNLEKSLFGIGTTPTTQDVIALRDAADRVDTLEDSEHGQRKAIEMFQRAATIGDTTMMQALVTRAFRSGWHPVLDLYTEQHPSRANELAALRRIDHLENDMQHTVHRGMIYNSLR